MKELFVQKSFNLSSRFLINHANRIIEDYQKQGYSLTLRQLYYQFVSEALIPNKQSEYKRLGSVLNDARLAGLVDWDAIEDRTRNLRSSPGWYSPQDILKAVARQYRERIWDDQPAYVEVWIEKDALIGVVEPVCDALRVPYFACRGYTSQSEAHAAGKRLEAQRLDRRKRVVIMHLGDHDPSGLDMTRDNRERLRMFSRCNIELRRLALHMHQIEEYNPPPNPAKDTDSRFAGYQEEFGDSSWELDALKPTVIGDLIRTEIEGLIDKERWMAAMAKEDANGGALSVLAARFPDLFAALETLDDRQEDR